MTWIFAGWMFAKLFVLGIDPTLMGGRRENPVMEGGSGQPPAVMEGGSGQPPKVMEGGSGQPPLHF
jgi:hypothetical protein